MKRIKIVFCGSHFSPAYGVIENLIINEDFDIYYIGRNKSMEGDEALSLESIYLKKLNIHYRSISNARLQRSLTWWTIVSILKFPAVFLQSFILIFKIRPELVVSFGGFIALPLCLSAWIMRIPIITHEQTAILGLANRVISKFAKITCLTYKNTKYAPKGSNTFITGNPIRKSIFNPSNNSKYQFGNSKLPLIYITGGSQGSESINSIVAQILPRLLINFRIIHQSGSADNAGVYRNLLNIINSLPLKLRKNYLILKTIDPDNTGIIYKKSTMVVGRAGANTVAELGVTGTPSILIPLPWSAENEQLENANKLKVLGLAEILKQDKLSSELLYKKIRYMARNIDNYKKNSKKYSQRYLQNGAKLMIDCIYRVLNRKLTCDEEN